MSNFKTVLCGVFLIGSISIRAQTFDEWFRQTRTRIKYEKQQVAALTVFQKDLDKGYANTENGLRTIADTTNKEFINHLNYYSGMKKENPALRNFIETSHCVNLSQRSFHMTNALFMEYTQSTWLNKAEKATVDEFHKQCLDEMIAEGQEMIAINGLDSLIIDEAERFNAIQRVMQKIEKRIDRLEKFRDYMDTVIKDRQHELSDKTIDDLLP